MRDHGEEHEDWDDVDDEGVTTPRGDHVEIGQRGPDCPENGTRVAGLKEDIEGEYQSKNRHSFVIIRSSNRSRHVTRCQPDKQSRKQTSPMFFRNLSGQQIRRNSRKRRKDRRNKHTDVSDIDGNG